MAFTPGSNASLFMGVQSGGRFGLALSATNSSHGIFYNRNTAAPAEPDHIALSPNGNSSAGVMNVYGNNRVGIGKDNPSYTLDVNGVVNAAAVYVNGVPLAGGGSQWVTSGVDIHFPTGKVGIGMTNPGHALDVNGTINATGLLVNGVPLTGGGSQWTTSGNNITYNSGNVVIGNTALEGTFGSTEKILQVKGVDAAWLSMQGGSTSFNLSASSMGTNLYSWGGNINFWTSPSGIGSNHMTISTNGNVGIGITSPDEKLSVNGQIHTKEVRVDLDNWPDYVFEKNYDLRSLAEIERYIDENKHLPEVPSAAEVEENGVKLGAMNALLLKKIEELTLYVIEQNKLIISQQERIEKLERVRNNK